MHTHLATLCLFGAAAIGCGPQAGPEPDPDWMLGTFSDVFDVDIDEHNRLKLVVRSDGTGDYIRLGCNGNDDVGAFEWEAHGNAIHMSPPDDRERFIVPSSEGSPFFMVLSNTRRCGANDLNEYASEESLFEGDPELVTERLFYKTNPCSGSSPDDDWDECPGHLECDPPKPCRLEWCDGEEPEPCG